MFTPSVFSSRQQNCRTLAHRFRASMPKRLLDPHWYTTRKRSRHSSSDESSDDFMTATSLCQPETPERRPETPERRPEILERRRPIHQPITPRDARRMLCWSMPRPRRQRVRQVDADTFRLTSTSPSSDSDQSVCPVQNALIRGRTSVSEDDDSSNQVTVGSSTSNSPQNQGIIRPEDQQPPQELVNNAEAFQEDLIPSVGSAEPTSFQTIHLDQLKKYFEILEIPKVAKYLSYDFCLKTSDKYLLAMVFAYFIRAKFEFSEYTELNFFIALYLANDLEEDEEDHKFEILPWAHGSSWKRTFTKFFHAKDDLLRRMNYQGIVSRRCCDEIMNIEPDHPIWKRVRKAHHAGATRPWLRPNYGGRLIGPDGTPRRCDLCNFIPSGCESESDTNKEDSTEERIVLEMDSSSSSLEEYNAADVTGVSSGTAGFNMQDVENNLMTSSFTSANQSNGERKSVSGLTEESSDWVDCFSDSDDGLLELFRQPEA